MMSIEAFVKLCAGHVEKGERFIAYHHPHGFMLLRTATPYTAFTMEPHGAYIESKETKRACAPKTLVNRLRKEIARMRKDPHCQPLRVVELDDNGNLYTEGADLNDLFAVQLSAGRDSVDS